MFPRGLLPRGVLPRGGVAQTLGPDGVLPMPHGGVTWFDGGFHHYDIIESQLS